MRVSLGATRAQIVRQLLVESFLLALAAGGLGLGMSIVGIRWFDANTQDVGKPYWMEFELDGSVFLFLTLVSVATVLLSGLAPALQVSRTDVNAVLKDGGRGGSVGRRSRRWAGALAVGQLVMTLVLLSGATFMMRSFLNMYRLDPGLDTSSLLTMEIYLPLTQYPEPEPRLRLFEDFERRLVGLPGLESTALATSLPLSGAAGMSLEVDGAEPVDPELRPTVSLVTVSDRYFETIDVPLLQGRAFTTGDGLPGSEVAIVNQRFADLHLGGDALGRRIRAGSPQDEEPAPWMTIVGVAPNVRQNSMEEIEPDPIVYQPLRANPARGVALLARTLVEPTQAATLVRESLRPVDPDLPVFDVRTMDEVLAEARWPFRTFGMMFTLFAAIALVLSAVGIYSITAHSVILRTQEFGIRMSLGALPREISWLALRRGLGHLAIGLPIGLLGAFGVGQLLQSLLVQMEPTDPLTFATIIGVLSSVVLLACTVPARRAAKLDPMVAFRAD